MMNLQRVISCCLIACLCSGVAKAGCVSDATAMNNALAQDIENGASPSACYSWQQPGNNPYMLFASPESTVSQDGDKCIATSSLIVAQDGSSMWAGKMSWKVKGKRGPGHQKCFTVYDAGMKPYGKMTQQSACKAMVEINALDQEACKADYSKVVNEDAYDADNAALDYLLGAIVVCLSEPQMCKKL